MRLELGRFPVRSLEWGERTRYEKGRLQVSREEAAAVIPPGHGLRGVELAIAAPGDSVRILHVLDVVEPRCRVGGGTSFPGMLDAPVVAGSGRSHRLDGAAVVATAEIGGSLDSQSVKEAIIDMSGPGAIYSEFSQTHNLVLTFLPDERASIPEQLAAVRLATLRVAEWLGRSVAEQVPEEV